MSHPSPSPGWTDARIETLTTLWRSGLSASRIAKALGGVTRNAVIGKVHRLGLAGRTTPRAPRPIRTAARAPARPLRARTRQSASQARERRTPEVEIVEIVEIGDTLELVTLAAHACRWPIGDPRATGFGFCGRPVNKAPYCESHRRRAFRPGAEPLERDPVLRRLLAGAGR
jgi:GcrA cell cycle regulator